VPPSSDAYPQLGNRRALNSAKRGRRIDQHRFADDLGFEVSMKLRHVWWFSEGIEYKNLPVRADRLPSASTASDPGCRRGEARFFGIRWSPMLFGSLLRWRTLEGIFFFFPAAKSLWVNNSGSGPEGKLESTHPCLVLGVRSPEWVVVIRRTAPTSRIFRPRVIRCRAGPSGRP